MHQGEDWVKPDGVLINCSEMYMYLYLQWQLNFLENNTKYERFANGRAVFIKI